MIFFISMETMMTIVVIVVRRVFDYFGNNDYAFFHDPIF